MPVLCLTVLFTAGSAADPVTRHGLAALTADMLDEGTADLDGLALHDALARIGSQLDTEVGVDAADAVDRHAVEVRSPGPRDPGGRGAASAVRRAGLRRASGTTA